MSEPGFGSSGDSNMLMWIKGLALNPCNSKASDQEQKLWNQSLNFRKVLFMDSGISSQIKRKIEQLQEDHGSAVACRMAGNKSNTPNMKKICEDRISASSSVSSGDSADKCHLVCRSHGTVSSLTMEDRCHEKLADTNITILDHARQSALSRTDGSPLIKTDESYSGLNQLSPENLNESTMSNFDETVHRTDFSSTDEHDSLLQKALKLWLSKGDNLLKSQSIMRVEEEDLKLRRALKLWLSNDDSLPRPVTPIGSGFQAEIPEWTGSSNRRKVLGSNGDSEDSRGLGTQIWPINGKRKGKAMKRVGKGRPDSCSCISPRSVDCVRHHIREARLSLQSEIGPAFSSWKFDEMGESISVSWTGKEQRSFESLVKMNPLSSGTCFWEVALKRFRSKSRKCLVSYYYNVFIPRRMSLQTRSSLEEIDSDEDQADNETK